MRVGWLVLCKDRDGVPDELGGRRNRWQYRMPTSAASAHSNKSDLGRQLLDNKTFKMLTNVRLSCVCVSNELQRGNGIACRARKCAYVYVCVGIGAVQPGAGVGERAEHPAVRDHLHQETRLT